MFCNSDESKIYHKYGNELQFTYVLCVNCRLVYQSPRPKYNEEFLEAAYGRYFMYNSDYKYNQKELAIFNEELLEITKFDNRKSLILDIGSAMGAFLKVSMDYYQKSVGLDVSKIMAEFSRKELGIEVFNEKFEDFNYGEKFSCIHMSHVIEHIPNPSEWLARAKQLMDPEGILVIAVPNMFSFTRVLKLFLRRIGLKSGKWKENWRTPDHLFEPTVPSMLAFLRSNNFEILDYYSYSRKNMTSKGRISYIFNRKLNWGSNLRFYAKVKNAL